MARKKPTVADVRADKGRYQYTMMRVESWGELAAAEIDMFSVPLDAMEEISKHTSLFLVSVGGGAGGDCRYPLACDVLGINAGHAPRHFKRYAKLAAEYARIQAMRTEAFKANVTDVRTGAYPSTPDLVKAQPDEMNAFRTLMAQHNMQEKKS